MYDACEKLPSLILHLYMMMNVCAYNIFPSLKPHIRIRVEFSLYILLLYYITLHFVTTLYSSSWFFCSGPFTNFSSRVKHRRAHWSIVRMKLLTETIKYALLLNDSVRMKVGMLTDPYFSHLAWFWFCHKYWRYDSIELRTYFRDGCETQNLIIMHVILNIIFWKQIYA